MLKKLIREIIREEDPETGKLLKETIRYSGRLRRILQDDTVLLIMFNDEEVLNMPFKIPSGKALHTTITISSILADSVKK